MGKTKRLTILHANDFHGQISFKITEDYTLAGGIALLSGYIKKVRRGEDAVFCAICGDILQDNIQNACSKKIVYDFCERKSIKVRKCVHNFPTR